MRHRSYQGFRLNSIWIIIGINFLLFIATIISRELIVFFGLAPINFLSQPWTIVTSMFIHAGFLHLFFNMITLYFFGSYFSRLVGEGRFLLVYFGGGILGGILYLVLGEPLSIMVGASGAVYALAGALVVMRPNIRVLIWGIIPMRLWMAVIVFFVIWSLPNVIPNVAWQAHLGGLIFGLIAGYFFRRRERRFLIMPR